MASPTKPIDLDTRVAGDSWEVTATVNGDATAVGVVAFMTIKRNEYDPDPGYAQRRSDQGGVTIDAYNPTTGTTLITFLFTRAETEPMREAAGDKVWYDIALCSSGSRKTTTQRGQIPIELDVTQAVP